MKLELSNSEIALELTKTYLEHNPSSFLQSFPSVSEDVVRIYRLFLKELNHPTPHAEDKDDEIPFEK